MSEFGASEIDKPFLERLREAELRLQTGVTAAEAVELARTWERLSDLEEKHGSPKTAALALEFAAKASLAAQEDGAARAHRTQAIELWLRAKAPDEALRCLKGADLEATAAKLLRARILRAKGEADGAIRILEQTPESPDMLELRAEINRDLGREDACLNDLARALYLRAHKGESIDAGLERLTKLAAEFGLADQIKPLYRQLYDENLVSQLRRRPRRRPI